MTRQVKITLMDDAPGRVRVLMQNKKRGAEYDGTPRSISALDGAGDEYTVAVHAGADIIITEETAMAVPGRPLTHAEVTAMNQEADANGTEPPRLRSVSTPRGLEYYIEEDTTEPQENEQVVTTAEEANEENEETSDEPHNPHPGDEEEHTNSLLVGGGGPPVEQLSGDGEVHRTDEPGYEDLQHTQEANTSELANKHTSAE